MQRCPFSIADMSRVCVLNLLETNRNLLYIRHQSVPRCKCSPPRL